MRRAVQHDVLLAATAALGVLLVHDLGYVLHHPFWLDEAWVVDSTRVRLSDLAQATASSPVGFSLLLRLPMLGGEQRQRLIPLAFAAATVSLAYLCGRQLGLRRSLSFLTLALPALMVPALLVRNDLKQYTAEAFWSLLVLLLLLRLECDWGRRRLVLLAVAVGLGPLFAYAALFVGSAALVAVAVTTLYERRWSRLREVGVAGLGALLLVILGLVVFVLPKQNPALTHYWDGYYLPTDTSLAWAFLVDRLQAVAPTTGLGSVPLVLLGCSVGTAGLLLRRRRASALLLPLAFAGAMLAGALHLYPLLDLRTSTWLSVLALVLTGLGVGQLCQHLPVRRRGAAVALAALAGLGFTSGNLGEVRSHHLADEDVRAQTRYVQQHRQPGDVVVVDLTANYGYGYYAGIRPLPIMHSPLVATGFLVRLDDPQVLAMTTQARDAPAQAVRAAAARLGPHGQVFLVRTHVGAFEGIGWREALSGRSVTALPVGPEPLLVLPPTAP